MCIHNSHTLTKFWDDLSTKRWEMRKKLFFQDFSMSQFGTLIYEHVRVGSTWWNLGDMFKIHSPVFFSLSYVLIKTKQPKNMKFGLLKKIAPPKTETMTCRAGIWWKIVIFRKFSYFKAYYWSPFIPNGYRWLHIAETNMGAYF